MIIALLLAAADPAAHALEIARKLPVAHKAMLELRREAAALPDPALRAAVETQLLAPGMPAELWADAHLDEARKLLRPPRRGAQAGRRAAARAAQSAQGRLRCGPGRAVRGRASRIPGRARGSLAR